jgi:signal transduction histidine kinase/ligand-binding sensor domain-containing protein
MVNLTKHNIRFLFILYLFFGIHAISSYGQPKELQFRFLTPKDGLSSSSINTIFQDHIGYIWIGTYNGLNRYDGYEFKVYNQSGSDTNSFPGYRQKALFEDRNKDLYIGSNIGLSLYKRDHDHFINYIEEESSPFYGINYDIFAIAEDSTGNLWLATDKGLVNFDRINNTTLQYTHDPNNPESLSNNWVETVFIDSKERIWAGTRNGLNLFQPSSKSFKNISVEEKRAGVNHRVSFISMVEDKSGNIWMASSNGLYCVENSPVEHDPLLTRYFHFPEDQYNFSGNRLLSVFIDDEDHLWAGAENGGLYLLEPENKRFYHYKMDESNPTSLNNESIQCIIQDNTKNLWVGTFGGGLNISEKNDDAIFHYKNLKGNISSLSNNRVSSFLQCDNGQIWVGTDGGGLNLFNQQTKRFTRYNKENSGLSSNSILDLAEDSNNNFWIASWGGGLMKYKADRNKFETFTMQDSKIPDNNIFSVTVGNNNDLWLGSYAHGLIHYRIDKNEFTSYMQSNSAILSNYVFVVKVVNEQIFIGTRVGLQIFTPKENDFETFKHDPNQPNSISHGCIYDILVENDSCIWIATQNGLNRFHPKTKEFEQYYKEDGLADNVIRSLLIDESGVLWIGTNSGISKFDYKRGQFENFSQDDGLQSNEFNFKSAIILENGHLLFGGTNGFNSIAPNRIIKNPNIPKIVITDFFLFNKPANAYAAGSPLQKDISACKEIMLSHHQNFLTFYFSAMDFTRPEKNRFSYMLENFDDNWIYSGSKREATYTNIDPGTYILHVIGSNNDGVWNEEGTDLKITILQPWYLTWYFKVIYAILFVGIILGIFYIRTATLRKQKERLTIKVAERTKDLEDKNLLLEQNSIELNKSNELLKSRQRLIEKQKESLMIQAEELKIIAENLEETNNELININATKDRFFSIVAHDLRSPFNGFLGFTQIMAEDLPSLSMDKIQELAERMRDSAFNLFRLLENLLQWASIQQGLFTFELKRLELLPIVDDCMSTISEMAKNKGIDIKIDVPEKTMVYADSHVVHMVIRNLLSNALKYTNKGGKVSLYAKATTTKLVEIFVKDTGIGMSKDLLDKLFRLDTKTNRRGTQGEPSSGLGLIICKDLIEKQGGELKVESKEGVGSVFSFSLQVG